MRFQSVGPPHPRDRHVAHADRLGERAGGPVRRAGGLLVQRLVQDAAHDLRRHLGLPPRTGGVPRDPRDAEAVEPGAPLPHERFAHAQAPGDLLVLQVLRGEEDGLGPEDEAVGDRATAGPREEPPSFFLREDDGRRDAHAPVWDGEDINVSFFSYGPLVSRYLRQLRPIGIPRSSPWLGRRLGTHVARR